MKKIITLCLSMAFGFAFAQQKESITDLFSKSNSNNSISKTTAFSYSFQKTTGTYSEFSGGTDVNGGMIWDDPWAVVPVGFTFDMLGEKVDMLDFRWGLGAELIGVKNGESSTYRPFILPFSADVIDRGYMGSTSLSSITYQTTGSSPNRVFTMQWKNVGFYYEGDSLGTYNDYMNFQMKLHESSNIIEYHMGPNSVLSPQTAYEGFGGPLTGFFGLDTLGFSLGDVHLLNGPANNPQLDTAFEAVTGTPANGTIYKFTPGSIGIEDQIKKTDISIHPNPASTFFRIDGINENDLRSVYIYDITGKEVMKVNGSGRINISDLNTGVYFVKIESKLGISTKKLVKN